MKIGPLDTKEKVIIIAEIGNNHEGDIHRAEEMIRAAAAAGVDAVKFQAIDPLKLVSQKERERVSQLQRFQLSVGQFERLWRVAADANVLFLCTPFYLEAVHFLDPLVPAFKIASGDNNFFPLLESVARTGKPLLISGGLSTVEELKTVHDFIRGIWAQGNICQEMAFLHCVVSYPTLPDQANLSVIRRLAAMGTTVGYSDHTLGIEAAVLSVPMGARIIEKHFTLNKQQSSFRDHQLSADPEEMRELVRRVREAEIFMGSVSESVVAVNEEIAAKVRRSIVAAHDLKPGTVIQRKDLNWVRSANGLAPGREAELIGRRLRCAVSEGESIQLTDLAAGSEGS